MGIDYGVTRVTRRGYRAEGFTSLFASVLSVHRHVQFSLDSRRIAALL